MVLDLIYIRYCHNFNSYM